ncbi:MAG: S41 family peptidase, partial [Planctomycetia bacterium]|nr:S41 family peptidase [Planctomycetia bacterium]
TTTWDGPMALIIDRSSASAAEVVAAALKSHGRATLVGQPTYGKDALQIVLPMEWGRSALDLTISRMSDPEGNSWGGAGVTPHHLVDVKNKSAEGDAKLDAMLAKAIEVLHRKIHNHSAQRAE